MVALTHAIDVCDLPRSYGDHGGLRGARPRADREGARGDEVLEAARRARPHVALLDIEMPGGDGLTAAAQLRDALPDVKVLILTTFGRPGFLRRAMAAGARGFLLKDAPAAELAPGTVRNYLSSAMQKLGAHSRAE